MDKIVSIKRKAQRLAQSGDLEKAVAEFQRLVDSGDLDPYDYVYFGDLLVKTKRLDEAVDRFREAMAAYERVGLYRNAIAVGKKILRIRPDEHDVCRNLGGLYFMDGLYTDSFTYYQKYLSSAPSDRDQDHIEEAGLRLLGMPLPNCEAALGIVETLERAGRQKGCAGLLLTLAGEFAARGDAEGAERLTIRAREIDAKATPASEGTGLRPGESGVGRLELGSGHHKPTSLDALIPPAPTGSEAAEEPGFGMISLPGDDISLDEEADGGLFDLSGIAEEPNAAAPLPVNGKGGGLRLRTSDGSGLDATEAAAESGLDAGAPATDGEPEVELLPGYDAGPWSGMDLEAIIAQADEFMAAGDTATGLDGLLVAARMAFHERKSQLAEKLYNRMVKLDPNHLQALEGLVELAHINGERGKIVRHGCELGDVLLAREEYSRAKLEFERVLQFDPRNEKARSRVSRLNSIEGVDHVTAQPLAPVASEVEGAMVSIRGEAGPARATQSLVDLNQILEEFKSAVAGQIAPEDAQSHYDMGMAYLEMGMPDSAAHEFEQATQSEEHQVPALELLARSQLMAGQPQAALDAVERAAGLGIDDPDRLAALFTYRGLALEALGQAMEAGHAMERALEYNPDFEMAREGMARLRGASTDAA